MVIVEYANDGAHVFFGIGQRVFLLFDNVDGVVGQCPDVRESLRFQRFAEVAHGLFIFRLLIFAANENCRTNVNSKSTIPFTNAGRVRDLLVQK